MLLSQLGEWGLIEKIAQQFHRHHPPGALGIGDDAAVIPCGEDRSLLVTTDLLIEDTHFIWNEISANDLGYKSLAVNLSDIAAMGGRPTSAFLSLGLKGDLSAEWLDNFFDGFQQLADSFQLPLMGGDTTESQRGLVINVTLLGSIENQNLKLRSGARPGDFVCVTGPLGDSAGGLRSLLEKRTGFPGTAHLLQAHHRPKAYVTEGQWLSTHSAVHAMMDVSDGLDRSLLQMAKRSNCGFQIHLEDLPISQDLRKACDQFQWTAIEMAAAGGEDYCLLFTVAADEFHQLQENYRQVFSQDVFKVGEVKMGSNSVSYLLNGQPYPKSIAGWNHFSG